MIDIKCSSSPQIFLESFKAMIASTPLCFLRLGCTKTATDDIIINSFESLRRIYPSKTPHYMDNLLEIAQAKQSSYLEEYVIMERSKGVISFQEINHAYNLLGNSINDETPSRRIIEIFKYSVL